MGVFSMKRVFKKVKKRLSGPKEEKHGENGGGCHATAEEPPLGKKVDKAIKQEASKRLGEISVEDSIGKTEPKILKKRTPYPVLGGSKQEVPDDDPLLGEVQLKSQATPKVVVQTPEISQTTSSMPRLQESAQQNSMRDTLMDPPGLRFAYDEIPLLELTKLPRGGLSLETEAVGRVQFGIPPETIKDSMRMGLDVPQVYIVPVERFCREMGPALGVNLAEFEFPAYFNFFVKQKRCTLVVDSADAEQNIRRVFSETLLGPAQFRREENPLDYEPEDFDADFPKEAIPNFQKELRHFRIMPNGKELVLETLLEFRHFYAGESVDYLGVPPPYEDKSTTLIEEDESPDLEDMEDAEEPTEVVPCDEQSVEKREKANVWTYSQTRWMGDVSTVWPSGATEEQIKKRTVPRIEIFKLPGGTEYVVHDVNENNIIIGKCRFSGNVKVSEQMSVDGFGGHSFLDDVGEQTDLKTDEPSELINKPRSLPPTFHPPSFGVTVLGNSHGFDASGSVSGYVLWINGRGVMIDPPPYASATLEREGIRPRMIVGIIITHCHADHDAGSFQKILTGSPVVVITTPTIYKSFIRKYAALSALSPALLRHSHRYKPAIIGQPLRFQGATFYITYTLHAIPCIGFRVEWRGRSMVFTGDHLNSPPAIEKLEKSGVLSRARAELLRQLPLQEADLLLHEAGAPPLHTPLEVLLKLPARVKKRLYVVHTSALPEGCELRVAPTGTAGTLRLDQLQNSRDNLVKRGLQRSSSVTSRNREDVLVPAVWGGANSEYSEVGGSSYENQSSGGAQAMLHTSFANLAAPKFPPSPLKKEEVMLSRGVSNARGKTDDVASIPLVSLRPASSTDAWFILNLLSAVPFLSSLSYASTMEVLETCRVDAYCMNDVVVPSSRRSQVLCVVWEGTCTERKTQKKNRVFRGSQLTSINENDGTIGAVWYAGDWTGPISLQPEKRLSGESELSVSHDVVAISGEGVKVITIDIANLHPILTSGSSLYRKYLERMGQQERAQNLEIADVPNLNPTDRLLGEAMKKLDILELLNCNSALRKLSAVQKRHLESLAEGPNSFTPGERIWRSGAPVVEAFVIVAGTASFVPQRRKAGSAQFSHKLGSSITNKEFLCNSIGEEMRQDALKAIQELGSNNREGNDEEASDASSLEDRNKVDGHFQFETVFGRTGDTSISHPVNDDYGKLSRTLQRHADLMIRSGSSTVSSVGDSSLDSSEKIDFIDEDTVDDGDPSKDKRSQMIRRRSSKARFANKVLGRLYSRRAFTGGLIFSRGHFLGDVSKMVAGLLASDESTEMLDEGPFYGFGDMSESGENRRGGTGTEVSGNISDMVIPEQGSPNAMHSSTLQAGRDGCVVLVFPKASLIPFLDEFPGLLLSLLGTQVVV